MADLDSLPLWLNVNSTYQPQDFRQLIDAVFGEGVLTGFAVSQRGAGANMSVDVAAGKAIVQGDSIALQGKYLAFEDSVKNEVVTAAPGANSRYDIVVLRIYDATATGAGANKAAIEVIAGTAAASPVVPSTPASALLLASIGPILTSTTSITNAMISNVAAKSTLAFEVVNSTAIGASAVTTAKIADSAVTGPKIVGGAISEGHIVGSAVTTAKIADSTVTNAKMADNSVGSFEIQNGAVIYDKLADGAVGEAKIAGGAVSAGKIADGAVTNTKIATSVGGTLASGTIGYRKLGDIVDVYSIGTGWDASGATPSLPAGYRPAAAASCAAFSQAGGASGYITVNTDGTLVDGGPLTNNVQVRFSMSYPAA